MYSIIDPEKTYDNANICLSQGILYRTQNNQISNSGFLIFPNPAYDNLHINFEIEDDQRATLLIQNGIGQVVQEEILMGSVKERIFNIQNLSNGVYTVKMRLNNEIIHQEKLVILR
ncbi:MAG: T9SS type A sorting domain-containing protein [Bacteroidetes bacterium]|nr:MAG: T9SS type A sorting domain-containing protein [Bacteroidota bacterium]